MISKPDNHSHNQNIRISKYQEFKNAGRLGSTCSGTASTAFFNVDCSPRCSAMLTASPYSCMRTFKIHIIDIIE